MYILPYITLTPLWPFFLLFTFWGKNVPPPPTFRHWATPLQAVVKLFVSSLKLYSRYEYTKPCMINRIWGLKTNITSGEWTCLISYATAPLTCSERRGSEKFKMKIYGHAWFHLHGLRWPVRHGEGAKNSRWTYIFPAGFKPTPRKSTTGKSVP